MVGLRVQLYLKTPLFPFPYLEAGARRTFPSDVVILEGRLKGDGAGGYWVEVERIGSADGKLQESKALPEAIIPSGKVDFLRVLGG